MVYRRRRYYKKKRPAYGGSKRYKNYSRGIGQLKHDVMKLKNLINVEFKSKDTSISITPSTTGIITTLNGLARGDTLDTREGRQVRWKSLEYDCEFYINPSSVNSNFVRTMFVIDKQPNAAAPGIGAILDSVSTVSQRNLDNRKRFVILYDKVIQLNVDSKDQARRHWYKALDMKTVYDSSNNGDITDITTNSIYFVALSNVAAVLPTLTGNVRLRFIDN